MRRHACGTYLRENSRVAEYIHVEEFYTCLFSEQYSSRKRKLYFRVQLQIESKQLFICILCKFVFMCVCVFMCAYVCAFVCAFVFVYRGAFLHWYERVRASCGCMKLSPRRIATASRKKQKSTRKCVFYFNATDSTSPSGINRSLFAEK